MNKFICSRFLNLFRFPPILQSRYSPQQYDKNYSACFRRNALYISIIALIPLLSSCIFYGKKVEAAPETAPPAAEMATPAGGVYGGCNNGSFLPHDEEERNRYKQANKSFCVRLFYATDRGSENDSSSGLIKYLNSRSENGNLIYGTVDVSVANPENHKIGSTNGFSLNTKQNTEMDEDEFFTSVSQRIAAENNSRKALIFVHGYNNSFNDAAIRTAQIYYDIEKSGTKFVPIFYSWASQADFLGYTIDETNSEWSQHNFYYFLKGFLEKTDANDVYLMAHSMGNRILTKALVDLNRENPSLKNKIKHIFLAAPDIDSMTFKRDVGTVLASMAYGNVSIYVSSRDRALLASKELHGSPRVGRFTSPEELLIFKGVETIDSSLVDLSFIGHDYAMSTCTALQDVEYWMSGRGGKRPWLDRKTENKITYYVFKNDHYGECKMPTYSPDLQLIDRNEIPSAGIMQKQQTM